MEKLTPADKKFIKLVLNKETDEKKIAAAPKVTRSNRFSGESIDLSPTSAAAVDFVLQVENFLNNADALKRIHDTLTPRNIISKFDRARAIVSKLDVKAYMTLLD